MDTVRDIFRGLTRRHPGWIREGAILSGLVALVFAVFGQTLRHAFIWFDDRVYVSANPHVMRGLSLDGVRWAFGAFHEANWHPLTWISHQWDVTLWGDWAGGHHLTNVVLHALNSVLVFLVLKGLVSGVRCQDADRRSPRPVQSASPWPAAFVAALFAVHPTRVESVAWVAERKDLLCAFFFLLTLWAYGRYTRARTSNGVRVEASASGSKGYQPGRMSNIQQGTSNAQVRTNPDLDVERSLLDVGCSSSPRTWYFFTLLLFALALMSKPMAVTLPFVLLLLDVWPLGRLKGCRVSGVSWGRRIAAPLLSGARGNEPERNRRMSNTQQGTSNAQVRTDPDLDVERSLLDVECSSATDGDDRSPTASRAGSGTASCLKPLLLEKLPFFALALASSVITVIAQRGAMSPLEVISPAQRVANALVGYGIYLRQFVWPLDLGLFYPYVYQRPAWQWQAAAGVLVLLTVVAVFAWRRRPHLATGWFWFLGMLVPVIGFVQVGSQAHADRYTYLPYIGLTWALAMTAAKWCGSHPVRRRLVVLLGGVAVLACAGLAHRQTATWRDSVTVFRQVLRVVGPHDVVLATLAGALSEAGHHEDALAHLEVALEAGGLSSEYLTYMAVVLKHLGRHEESITRALEALALNPGHVAAYGVKGESLSAVGRHEDAIEVFSQGLRLAPDTGYLLYGQGQALAALGRHAEAATRYRRALDGDPRNWVQRAVLADALVNAGAFDAAEAELVRAAGDRAATRQAVELLLVPHLRLAAALERAGLDVQRVRVLESAAALDRGLIEPRRLLLPALFAEGGERLRRAADELHAAIRVTQTPVFEACNDLAWVRATHRDPTVRDGPQAQWLALRAVREGGGRDPAVLDTLGAANAELGRFHDAVTAARRALELLGEDGDPEMRTAIEGRIQAYQREEPWREL